MVEKDKGAAGALGEIVKLGVSLVTGKKETPQDVPKSRPMDQLKARAESAKPAATEVPEKKVVYVAEAKPSSVVEGPVTPQVVRFRVREAAMEKFKTDYNKLPLGDKLKLLIEEAQKNPGENAATLTENLAALQKLPWERPSQDQLKKIESIFAQLPKDTRLELRERSVLVEARRVVSLHLTDEHNAPKYDIKSDDLGKIAKMLHVPEISGGLGPASATAEWWATERNGHRGTLYGDDPADKPFGPVGIQEVEEFLKDAQRRIDNPSNPEGSQSRDLMGELDHRFQKILDEYVRKHPRSAIPDNVYQYRNVINENFRALIEMSRDHVSLGLSGEYKQEIWRNGPEAMLFAQIREVERFSKSYEGDTFKAESAMRVLQQMQHYVTDPEFVQEWRRYLLSQKSHPSVATIDRRVARFVRSDIDKLSNDIDLRRNLVKNYNAFTAVGLSEEKLSQLLSPFGSEGALAVLGYEDGKVQAAFDYFDAVLLSEHRALHSDDHVWLSMDELKRLYKEATVEMKRGAVSDLAGLSEQKIEEIAFLAQEVHFLFGRPVLAMNRGLSPIESGFYLSGTRPDKIHPFSGGGGSNMERAASARKMLRFGFYRWILDNKGVRGNLDSGAQFAAHGNHVESVVNGLIVEAQRRNKVEDLVRYICNISDADMADSRKDAIIEDRLSNTFLKFDLKGNHRSPPKTLEKAAANIPLLKERMMSNIGTLIMESSVMDYTMLDSGPMCRETITRLSEMFTYSDQLAISMQIREKYADVLGSRDHKSRVDSIDKLKTVLEKAALYNPIDLLNGHIDTRNFATQDWFNGLNHAQVTSFLHPDEVAAGDVTTGGDLVKVLTRRAASVESAIKRKVRKGVHLGRINWQATLSPEHDAVVLDALRAAKGMPKGTPDQVGLSQFKEIMKSVSEHVGHQQRIEDAVKPDFMVRYGYQTMNSMDCWLDLAEARDAQGRHFGDKQGSVRALSATLGGRGSGDLLVRTHGDTETALKAKDVLFQAVQTQDWKMYIKAAAEIRQMSRNVYGTPWDGRSVMYYTAGLLDGMKQDTLTEMSFDIVRFISPKDSKLRRLLDSEHAASVSLDDRHEYIGELENTVMQSLEDYDKELGEYFLEYVGLNFGKGWHFMKDEAIWRKRIYRVVAFASVLLAVALAKEGWEEIGGSTGGGGGAHH